MWKSTPIVLKMAAEVPKAKCFRRKHILVPTVAPTKRGKHATGESFSEWYALHAAQTMLGQQPSLAFTLYLVRKANVVL